MRIKLDRSGNTLLAHQLTEWLKAAIRRGDYKDGDVLPGAEELAAAANVCERTARRALADLAAEGWTVTKRHVGSVIVERGLATLRRKRLLFFADEPYYCYYYDQLVSGIRDHLLDNGVGVSVASVCGCRIGNRFHQLEEFLGERWDLILPISATAGAHRILERQGWPFVAIAEGIRKITPKASNFLGHVDIARGQALPDFVRECVGKGVQRVLQVLGLPNAYDASVALEAAGVASDTIRVRNGGSPESMTRGGFTAVRDWFASGRDRPDVILFTDDYAAQGGLVAINSLDLRIPDDVAVVTHANKGHGPFWEKPLTRLEMDPVAHGKILAGAIAAYLRGEPFPQDLRLGSRWVQGETF